MSRRIIYSLYYKIYLKKIITYIKKDSKNRAKIFLNEIKIKVKNLKIFPNLGIEINLNTRKLFINKNYKIIYKIEKDKIIILSIKNVKLK